MFSQEGLRAAQIPAPSTARAAGPTRAFGFDSRAARPRGGDGCSRPAPPQSRWRPRPGRRGSMCDPAVCSFLTQTLCAHGGRLGLRELQENIGLSALQLEDTLSAAGPRRFLKVGSGPVVLAVTDVRVCVRKACDGCERLHLCKLHLMGRCHQGPSSCKYSHDIMNAENKKVLKKHDLSGLSENELQVLLLQNDPFFLPDTCQFYNTKGGCCRQQSNCNKLHVCRHFLKGKCKFPQCIMNHNLLDDHAMRVLETGGIDGKIASNFQAIYDFKHVEFNKEQKKGYVHNYRRINDYWKIPANQRNKEVKTTTVQCMLDVPPSKGPSSTVPAQSQDQLPTGAGDKGKGPSSTVPAQSQDQLPTGAGDKGPSSTVPAQSQDQLPTGAGDKGPSSTVPAQSQDQLPTGAGDKGPSSTVPAQSQDQLPTGAGDKGKGPSSTVPAQSQDQLPTGVGDKGKGKKDSSSDEASKDNKKDNCDEICLFYVWKYCKNKDKCKSVHYHLPYKWEIHDGLFWHELSMMEEIEKAYCDPKNSSLQSKNINFQTMTCSSSLVRRLSTPSSVTKPTFLLTTQWIWYWKNNQDKWIEYGEQEEGNSVTAPSSAIIENLYQADPCAIVPFQAGQHQYELNFKEMTQTNITFKTKRQVCRRPKFVSSEDVQKIKTGSQRDSSIPSHWDASALPDLGYKAVVISNATPEYNEIKQLFHQTMKNYSILKILRIQNPSLWKVFQWQKEKMKRENGGKEVQEKLLFHGTDITSMKTICTQNFDWRICGSNGTNYGKGSYFARDACYSHAYCQATLQGYLMFVARVLVGDYVKGNAAYVRPPKKCADKLWFYDSCVDNELNPSVFVVFEKHQIYPEYIVEYKEERIREQKEPAIIVYKAVGIRQQKEAEIRVCKEDGIREHKEEKSKCVIS
ncbi:PREDICTED: zinc finger CCCH-type antiviral protein 1-like isoform X8 [Ficedula albicollis]|uniref:zinc finger CCCH-type antiviral protein 1-like isoform X8 n=1 Tax=Ficedula albicollis TaxID=59894 RepID=UPI0007AD84A0|nr:PREDICTED: zinc finger CCCH-type antiviral protein 1-like isoform X8 [Ficedula albicollis]